jgi:hypothetical protein
MSPGLWTTERWTTRIMTDIPYRVAEAGTVAVTRVSDLTALVNFF